MDLLLQYRLIAFQAGDKNHVHAKYKAEDLLNILDFDFST